MATLVISLMAAMSVMPRSNVYDVWAEPNLHLMMSDNGTPDDYEDDWVVDWEDNRDLVVYISD